MKLTSHSRLPRFRDGGNTPDSKTNLIVHLGLQLTLSNPSAFPLCITSQNLSRQSSALRRSYDEDAAFAVGDEELSDDVEDLSQGDGDDSEIDAFAVRDGNDDLAVRDDDDAVRDDSRYGQSGDTSSSEVEYQRSSDEEGSEASSGIHTDDDASSVSSKSESDYYDARKAAGVGLTKRELLQKKVEEENSKLYFANEEVREQVYRRKAAKAARANQNFEALMQSVEIGMGDGGVVAKSDDLVYARELALSKKLKEIHTEWEEEIFNKLQLQIKKHVDGVDCEVLSERLRREGSEYCEAGYRKQKVNKNAGVFLESVVGYDYDPYGTGREKRFAATVNSLSDPTKRDIYKPVKEEMAAGRVADASEALQKVVPKETLAVKFWHNLEYTPYGRYTDKDGELLPPEAQIKGFFRQGEDLWNKHSAANVRDEYNHPKGKEGYRVNREEYFRADRGGARKAQTSYNAMPSDVDGGRDPNEVVFQTGKQQPGFPNNKSMGDQWLEKKHVAFVENLAIDKNRPDLFGVFHQDGLRDSRQKGDKSDTNPRGDAWYSRKGLACFEELAVQKSNRKGLYTVLQGGGTYGDSRNPAGQNVGDFWLDQALKDPVFSVDGKKWGSRYSGDAQGDLYGQLSHTHKLPPHPTKRLMNGPDPIYDRMQKLNDAEDEGRHSRGHVQQYMQQI